jgi:hypothetical protein
LCRRDRVDRMDIFWFGCDAAGRWRVGGGGGIKVRREVVQGVERLVFEY